MNRPVRVLMYMFFPGGGIGRYTHELASELNRRDDVEVELACSPNFEYLTDADYPTWPNLMRLSSPRPLIRRSRFLAAQIVSPSRVINRAKQTGAEIIHFSNINHLTFPFWHRQLDKQTRMRVVATAHDVRRAKKIINRNWETRALKDFYRRADALFLHSRQQKEDMLKFASVSEDSIHQVPMGTIPYALPTGSKAELRKKLGIPEHRKVGLFFGLIRDDKNLDAYLEAMSQLQNRPYLVIAGRMGGSGGKTESFYRAEIQKLNLKNDVQIINRFIEDDEIGDFFAMSDFVALPYKNSFTSQSAVLNVAMHYERPILCSPAATIAETATTYNVGIVSKSDQADDLATATTVMHSMLDSGSGFDFTNYKENFSWRVNAELTSRVYHQIVRHRN